MIQLPAWVTGWQGYLAAFVVAELVALLFGTGALLSLNLVLAMVWWARSNRRRRR